MFYRAPDVLLTNPLPKASLGAWISCSVATHPRTPPHVEDDAWAWNYPVPMTQSRLVRVLSTPRPGQLRLRQLGRGPRNISINWGNAWREVEGGRQTVLQEKRHHSEWQELQRQMWFMIKAFQPWTTSNLNRAPPKLGRPGSSKFAELKM